jgi:hypothetical protein
MQAKVQIAIEIDGARALNIGIKRREQQILKLDPSLGAGERRGTGEESSGSISGSRTSQGFPEIDAK